jgi:hypothetical protein
MKYDSKGCKWLRVRNWEKYQPDAKLRNKTVRLPWVKSWVNKLDNYDYQQLTTFQRGLLADILVLAGSRPLRSIPNDPTWVAHALHVIRTDIPHVPHAITTLVSRGYLIPTNTERFFEDEDEIAVGDRDREGDREGGGDSSVSQSVSYEEADASLQETREFVVIDTEVPVHDLPCFTLLHEEFGRAEKLPDDVIRRVHSALKALGRDEVWMQGCIQYTQNHKKFWANRAVNAGAFANALINGINDPLGKMLPAQYDRYVAQKRRAAGAGKR